MTESAVEKCSVKEEEAGKRFAYIKNSEGIYDRIYIKKAQI